MKMSKIVKNGEYIMLVPTHIRIVQKDLSIPNGNGGSRMAGVAVELVDSGLVAIVRCDRIKDKNTIPFHRKMG